MMSNNSKLRGEHDSLCFPGRKVQNLLLNYEMHYMSLAPNPVGINKKKTKKIKKRAEGLTLQRHGRFVQ